MNVKLAMCHYVVLCVTFFTAAAPAVGCFYANGGKYPVGKYIVAIRRVWFRLVTLFCGRPHDLIMILRKNLTGIIVILILIVSIYINFAKSLTSNLIIFPISLK